MSTTFRIKSDWNNKETTFLYIDSYNFLLFWIKLIHRNMQKRQTQLVNNEYLGWVTRPLISAYSSFIVIHSSSVMLAVSAWFAILMLSDVIKSCMSQYKKYTFLDQIIWRDRSSGSSVCFFKLSNVKRAISLLFQSHFIGKGFIFSLAKTWAVYCLSDK